MKDPVGAPATVALGSGCGVWPDATTPGIAIGHLTQAGVPVAYSMSATAGAYIPLNIVSDTAQYFVQTDQSTATTAARRR